MKYADNGMTAHLVSVVKRPGKPGSLLVHRVLVLTLHPGPLLRIPHDADVATFEGGPRSLFCLRADLGEQRDRCHRPHDLTGCLPRLARRPSQRCLVCCQVRGLTAPPRAVRQVSKAARLSYLHRGYPPRSRILWVVKHLTQLNDALAQ
jgi:hypothetical protein